MELVSYYKTLAADQQTLGGVGQGGGNYWTGAVGIRLQQAIAGDENTTLVPRPHGKDSFDVKAVDTLDKTFDVAYVQMFDIVDRRPATICYSIISDYKHMEQVLEDFLEHLRPDFIITLQYPFADLVDQCAKYDTRVVHMPWFNTRNEPPIDENHEWTADAICTGTMGGTYPRRTELFKYLSKMHDDQLAATGKSSIVLSGSLTGCTGFRLSDEQYHHAMRHSKYSFSGGIYDYQIPPKYFEICNFGACLVSHDMPLMADCGFIPDETYVRIENVEQIPEIIASDKYKTVAVAGQKMVHERHSLEARAKQIREYIKDQYGIE